MDPARAETPVRSVHSARDRCVQPRRGTQLFNFDILLQQILNGLVLGSVYAMVALGYTMVYGILQLINFAHGEVLMIGAMVAVWLVPTLLAAGVPGPLVLLIVTAAAIPVCMLLSMFIERVAYRPLRNAPRLAPLITAIGMSIVLQTVAMIIWKPNPIVFPDLLPTAPVPIPAHTTANCRAAASASRTGTVATTPQLRLSLLAYTAVLATPSNE